MKKSILITGVAGLLGSRMANWILENHPEYEVVGIDNLFGGYIDNIPENVIFYKKEWKNINKDHFRKAIDKTFTKREYKGDPFEGLDIIRNSEVLKERWNKYQRNFSYSEGIEFEDIMNCLEIMIEQFEPVGV